MRFRRPDGQTVTYRYVRGLPADHQFWDADGQLLEPQPDADWWAAQADDQLDDDDD